MFSCHESGVGKMGRLFHLPAFVSVELDFKATATLMISPARVDPLVLIIRPLILPHAQFKAVSLEDISCLVHGADVVVTIGDKRVANAIMDLVHMLLHGLVRLISDQFKEFLLEPVILFKSVLLCIFDKCTGSRVGPPLGAWRA